MRSFPFRAVLIVPLQRDHVSQPIHGVGPGSPTRIHQIFQIPMQREARDHGAVKVPS